MCDAYVMPTHTEETIKAKPVKPPFGYYGAKQRLASRIVNNLPPHNAWVEGFCGSAALTLAKKPAQIEVINDLDGQIVNLFEQLRSNTQALCDAVSLTPYAREDRGARQLEEGLEPWKGAKVSCRGNDDSECDPCHIRRWLLILSIVHTRR